MIWDSVGGGGAAQKCSCIPAFTKWYGTVWGGEGLHKSAAVYLHLLNDLGQCGGKGLHKSAAKYLHLLMFWDSACVGGGGKAAQKCTCKCTCIYQLLNWVRLRPDVARYESLSPPIRPPSWPNLTFTQKQIKLISFFTFPFSDAVCTWPDNTYVLHPQH